ncbi:hypothetical protein ACFVZH_40295 [Streptomyces sp. NPDC059534]|uniref:hypothetical protein n=1 Tax=Streptomyces sp. NPDC059534 TaxID=3346859 RepID=UPI0036A8B2BB
MNVKTAYVSLGTALVLAGSIVGAGNSWASVDDLLDQTKEIYSSAIYGNSVGTFLACGTNYPFAKSISLDMSGRTEGPDISTVQPQNGDGTSTGKKGGFFLSYSNPGIKGAAGPEIRMTISMTCSSLDPGSLPRTVSVVNRAELPPGVTKELKATCPLDYPYVGSPWVGGRADGNDGIHVSGTSRQTVSSTFGNNTTGVDLIEVGAICGSNFNPS